MRGPGRLGLPELELFQDPPTPQPSGPAASGPSLSTWEFCRGPIRAFFRGAYRVYRGTCLEAVELEHPQDEGNSLPEALQFGFDCIGFDQSILNCVCQT